MRPLFVDPDFLEPADYNCGPRLALNGPSITAAHCLTQRQLRAEKNGGDRATRFCLYIKEELPTSQETYPAPEAILTREVNSRPLTPRCRSTCDNG